MAKIFLPNFPAPKDYSDEAFMKDKQLHWAV